MKLSNILATGVIVAFAGLVSSCVDKDPDYANYPNPDVDFAYEVDGDEYKTDYYVVSTIKFTNTSSKSGAISWDFGDGTTSTDPNPTHKFDKAGVYKVTLTIDEVGSQTYPILIYDIVPILSIAEKSSEIVYYNDTEVKLGLELPNPENLRVKYVWKFPDGTLDKNGDEISEFVGYAESDGSVQMPENLRFRNIGSQKIEISSWFDVDGENRRLEDAYLNVQVGTKEPAPTLYYAQQKGNIKALKLLDVIPEGTKVLPFDMGVPAGNTVFNLLYGEQKETREDETEVMQGYVYILDAGKQYYYINDEDGVLGDGQITAMRTDGTGVNTLVTNVGGAAFLDPFVGCIYNGNIYYSDRNTGVTSRPLTARGEVEGKISSSQRDSYVFQNNTISYYGRGMSYGAISSSLYRDSKGYWWWGKKFNGEGIFRFNDSQIYADQKTADSNPVPGPVLLSGMKATCFGVDETRKALYVWRRSPSPGFLVYPLPAGISDGLDEKAFTKYIAMDATAVNTTESEGLFTTQFAIDPANGRVYFCFRPEAGGTAPAGITAGIVYYDPADQQMHNYGTTTDLGTGIVINPNKTELF